MLGTISKSALACLAMVCVIVGFHITRGAQPARAAGGGGATSEIEVTDFALAITSGGILSSDMAAPGYYHSLGYDGVVHSFSISASADAITKFTADGLVYGDMTGTLNLYSAASPSSGFIFDSAISLILDSSWSSPVFTISSHSAGEIWAAELDFDCSSEEPFILETISIEAGAVDSATYKNCIQYGQDTRGPYSSLDPSPLATTPFSGVVHQYETYVAELFDANGVPAKNQPVLVTSDDASVLKLRGFGHTMATFSASAILNTDDTGHVLLQLEYQSAGSSGLTFESAIPDVVSATSFAAPDDSGLGASFQSDDRAPAGQGEAQKPTIKGIIAKTCSRTKGASTQNIPINCGLQSGLGIFVFGAKYTFEVDTGGQAWPSECPINWCYRKLADSEWTQCNESTGTTFCINIDDPNAAEGDAIHVFVKAIDASASDNVGTVDIDFHEKKTIPICVFSKKSNSEQEWIKVIECGSPSLPDLNACFQGTGVCFDLQEVTTINDECCVVNEKSAKQVPIDPSDPSKGEVAEIEVEGSFVQCLCGNASFKDGNGNAIPANEQPAADPKKLTFFDGIKFNNRMSQKANAIGADEVLKCEGKRIKNKSKWRNIALFEGNPQCSSSIADRRLLCHETGHLLGLKHVDDDTNVMQQTGTGRKFSPSQASTIYREACEILAGE